MPDEERGSEDDDYDIGEGLILSCSRESNFIINPGQGISNSKWEEEIMKIKTEKDNPVVLKRKG